MLERHHRDNLTRLKEAKIIVADELPEEYQAVVKGLTPDEVDALVAIKARLDEAERTSGTDVSQIMIAP